MRQLLLIGVSHKTAPIEWRERLAVPEARLPAVLASLKGNGVVQEAVVVSTCNRVEIYAATGAPEDARPALRGALAALHADPAVAACLYAQEDEAAVRQLFRVAAGLDSMVIGESEILGQVKRAYEAALAAQATGKLTNVLFQRALYIGKKVRTDTGIAEGPTSAASLAVALAERIFGDLRQSRVLVVGAGAMAEQAARCLASQKVARFTVVNRTLSKAEELARQFGGAAAPMDRLLDELAAADIVLCSTGSPEAVLRHADVAAVMRRRRGRSLFLIDIAVPRDVEPAVHKLENVYLYNIDDLESIVAESLGRRQAEIDKAVRLVDDRAREFAAWYAAWRAGETVALRHKGPGEGAALAPAPPRERSVP